MQVVHSATDALEVERAEDLDRVLRDIGSLYPPEEPTVAEIAIEGGGALAVGLGHEFGFLSIPPGPGEVRSYASVGDPEAVGVTVFYYMGAYSEIPRRNLVPIEVVRRAAVDFCRTGSRPEYVTWEEMGACGS